MKINNFRGDLTNISACKKHCCPCKIGCVDALIDKPYNKPAQIRACAQLDNQKACPKPALNLPNTCLKPAQIRVCAQLNNHRPA